MMQWPDLTPVLSPILWAVVGATATRLYMPERYTRNLEIAVGLQDTGAVKRSPRWGSGIDGESVDRRPTGAIGPCHCLDKPVHLL